MNPTTVKDFIEILINLLQTAVPILIALALLFFFWNLAIWIFNVADTDEHKKGKQRMIWGLVILFVIISVGGLVAILQETFFGGSLSSGQRGSTLSENGTRGVVIDRPIDSSGSSSFAPSGGFGSGILGGVTDWFSEIRQ